MSSSKPRQRKNANGEDATPSKPSTALTTHEEDDNKKQTVLQPQGKPGPAPYLMTSDVSITPWFITPLIFGLLTMAFMWYTEVYTLSGFLAKIRADSQELVRQMMPKNRYQN